MAEIVMPRLSDSMEEGTILSWLKQVGDEIAVGDEIVEIETDKANMAYESDVAGTLTEIVAKEGETLPIGTVIAKVGDSAEGSSRTAAEQTAETPSEARALQPRPITPAAGSGQRVKASPVARRLAQDKGVDLVALHGSGPGGRIVKADVEKAEAGPAAPDTAPAPGIEAAPAPAASPLPPSPISVAGSGQAAETAKGQTAYEDLSKLQSTIARRMAESKATAPHFYLEAEVDMTAAVKARAAIKAGIREGDVVPSFNDMVVKACALALREFPRANGAYRDGRFELYSRVNVGIAVAGQDALVVPTVFDADRKGLRQIATESRAMAVKVRDGSITPPELSGGTFTVSNLGMYGIDAFAAVINAPQAGILAVGAIKERPAVRDGAIVPAQLMNVTLACDHRILYGADGAEFLARVRALLEEPVSLAL
jgi:pyruvate dehydrogenase E2 component (dihydrolipoamide acetyltransferase)